MNNKCFTCVLRLLHLCCLGRLVKIHCLELTCLSDSIRSPKIKEGRRSYWIASSWRHLLNDRPRGNAWPVSHMDAPTFGPSFANDSRLLTYFSPVLLNHRDLEQVPSYALWSLFIWIVLEKGPPYTWKDRWELWTSLWWTLPQTSSGSRDWRYWSWDSWKKLYSSRRPNIWVSCHRFVDILAQAMPASHYLKKPESRLWSQQN